MLVAVNIIKSTNCKKIDAILHPLPSLYLLNANLNIEPAIYYPSIKFKLRLSLVQPGSK